MRRLRQLGLDGATFRALAGSGDLTTMRQINTRAEVRRLEQLYAQRAQAQNTSARVAGDAEYGRQINAQNRLLTKLDRRLDGLERAMERGVRNGAREGIKQGARGAVARRRAGF